MPPSLERGQSDVRLHARCVRNEPEIEEHPEVDCVAHRRSPCDAPARKARGPVVRRARIAVIEADVDLPEHAAREPVEVEHQEGMRPERARGRDREFQRTEPGPRFCTMAAGEIAMRPPGSRTDWVMMERTVSCRSAGCEKFFQARSARHPFGGHAARRRGLERVALGARKC